eukprot:403345449
MGNSESSNKEAMNKMKNFQQQNNINPTQTGRIYTSQNLPIETGYQSSNPWEAQQQYNQDKRENLVRTQPAKEINKVENQIFLDRDSLKFVNINSQAINAQQDLDQSKCSLQFSFTQNQQHSIVKVYQGCIEHIKQVDSTLEQSYKPLPNTQFVGKEQVSQRFDEIGKHQFNAGLVIIDFNDYLANGQDYTKASLSYFPLIIQMTLENPVNFQDYQALYYLQISYQPSSQTWHPTLIKQRMIINSHIYDLTEAYGIGSNRTDEVNSTECVICLTNRKNTLTQPCKHVSLCDSCAYVVFKNDKKCPVCRQKIYEIIPFKLNE